MSAITTCGAMLSSCSTAFAAELNGKTWCPFSRQSVTITSTIAGSSSIITIFAMKSQRGEYFSFEKKKAEMRIRWLGDFLHSSVLHQPIDPLIERQNFLKHTCWPCTWNSDQVGISVRSNFAQRVLLPQHFR